MLDSQPRQFRTFEHVLEGLRELVTAGWQVRLELVRNDRQSRRVAMLEPDAFDWRFCKDPLEALAVHFVPDSMFDGLLGEQAAVLGLDLDYAQWIYALGAEDRFYLEHTVAMSHYMSHFAGQRQQLLAACGLTVN